VEYLENMKRPAKMMLRSANRNSTPSVLTILGCGTSSGVPFIGCPCKVCRSKNPKNTRTRSSVWIRTRGKSLLIDSSSDLRQQALREKILQIDAVLYTHPHADHVSGIDDLRSYNFLQKTDIPIYGNAWSLQELTSRYPYIFSTEPAYREGGGTARLVPHLFDSAFLASGKPWNVEGIPVLPIPVSHGSRECLGYRVESVAYVTDCSYIPDSSLDRLKELSVLVLDCLQLRKHGTHFHLDQALETIRVLRPKKTVLTHLGHDFDYLTWNRKLASIRESKVSLAYDGLKLRW